MVCFDNFSAAITSATIEVQRARTEQVRTRRIKPETCHCRERMNANL